MCNSNQDQSVVTLILYGYNNSESVIHCKLEDVRKSATDKSKIAATQGGSIYVGIGVSSASKALFIGSNI